MDEKMENPTRKMVKNQESLKGQKAASSTHRPDQDATTLLPGSAAAGISESSPSLFAGPIQSWLTKPRADVHALLPENLPAIASILDGKVPSTTNTQNLEEELGAGWTGKSKHTPRMTSSCPCRHCGARGCDYVSIRSFKIRVLSCVFCLYNLLAPHPSHMQTAHPK